MISIFKKLQAELGSLGYIRNYIRFFFSSHRDSHINNIKLVEPINSKLDIDTFFNCMKDVFIVSRNYNGDLGIFLNTIKNLRAVIDTTKASPKNFKDCRVLIDKLQYIQKQLIYATDVYESLIDYYSNDLPLAIRSQAIKRDCYLIFDHCNNLIRKLVQLERNLSKQ